jgi:hypothetical protein
MMAIYVPQYTKWANYSTKDRYDMFICYDDDNIADYVKGMDMLEKRIGKDNPLKCFGKSVIIDFKKMYWDSIKK